MLRLITLLLLTFKLLSAATVLTDETKKVEHFLISYAYDKTRALGIGDVSEMNFKEVSPSEFNFGYLSGNTWIKLDIKNVSYSSDFLLYFDTPYFEEYTVYEKKRDLWHEEKIGLFTKLKDRKIVDANPIYPLEIARETTKTYYIKLHSKFSQLGEFRIYKESSFLSHDKLLFLSVYVFAFGAMMMIILLNSFLAYRLKDRHYGYFAAYVAFFVVYIALLSGLGLYIGFETVYYELYVSAPLMLVFLVLFSTKYIKTKKYAPKFHQFFVISIVIYFISAILILFDVDPWYKMMSVYSGLVLIVLLITALKVAILGQKNAKIYFYIMLPMSISYIMMLTVMNNMTENNTLNHYSFLYVGLLSIIVFSLVLANKFYETKGLVNRDPLTRLFNRRYFTDIAEKYFSTEERTHRGLSAIVLDIDKFKTINQIYGQVIGDDILVIVSDILREHSRDSDIPVRMSGEEFMILFPETSLENAEMISERIRARIEETVIEDRKKNLIKITVSIGVSQVRNGIDTDIDRVIQRADEALYTAKREGRNQVKVLS